MHQDNATRPNRFSPLQRLAVLWRARARYRAMLSRPLPARSNEPQIPSVSRS